MQAPIPPKAPTPAHAEMSQFLVRDGELHVGGLPLRQLAARVGATPFYAYDRAVLSQRVALLRRHLPAALGLHYAMKANPMPALLGFLRPLVDGIDVASAQEMKTALDAGAAPQHISFAGPGKRPAELRQAVAAGVLLNVESATELERVAQAGIDLGMRPRVALRLNPDFELKGSAVKMSGGPKPFGIDAEQAPAVLRAMKDLDLAFEGFHIFAGSQNLNAESICEAQRKSYQLALQLAEQACGEIRSLNLGGGFGIPYFPGEQPLDLGAIGENLNELCASAERDFPQARLAIELGRYLVGEAGLFVTRVVDKKQSRGMDYLVCDGGMNHHLAASGNFGQVLRKNYPVALAHKMDATERHTVCVVGPLCTPLDILADRVQLPPAECGDLIVVFQSGAYGASASPQAFLSQAACLEVLV
ncbi:MAG: pyridoxal-dependent decarboxylase, exosortase A system-associated [Paucibacter sp.]|nr:pyridoxal-dependent decarboxylase, exosortase A system-associated [Roseateles sp.]